MKILEGKKRAFFIGIGGIGMSALARYLSNKGIEIYGYDRTETVLTKKLEDEGMKIHYEDRIDLIPDNIDIVVYTPAIPSDHKEKNWLIANGHKLLKRSELLKEILAESRVIAVAGTHGKTSTSAILSHLLHDTSCSATCFVGGIMVNYNTNFLYSDSNLVVVEADEYDRSFLRLFPEVAIMQALDPDHLDIYGSPEEMIKSYRDFTMQISEGGLLVVPDHVSNKMSTDWKEDLDERKVEFITYGEGNSEVKVMRMTHEGLTTKVKMNAFGQDVKMTVPFPGRHNALNAVGASIVAYHLGLDWAELAERMRSFRGVRRRFEVIYQSDNQTFIDDYAHHPEEIKAIVSGLRKSFPGKKIVGVFQPHLYTRTKDFVKGFAKELDALDEILLLPIYPARELPIEGVESELILNLMKNEQSKLIQKNELIEELKNKKIEVLVTIGAGDIDKLVPVIKKEIFCV
jgi:UDP-N-acetylmuramate--alanine ligase